MMNLVMHMENQMPVRKPLRMSQYDYNTPGAYFLTFCTHDRKQFLSRIVGAIHESPEMQLTASGKIVETILQNIPKHLHVSIDRYVIMPNHIHVSIDRYVIMPNHIHLIAVITEEDVLREIRESPLRSRSVVSKLIGYIKMNASKAIRQHYGDVSVWQRGYYDHVIRNEADYLALVEYIQTNPLRWELDKLYSEK